MTLALSLVEHDTLDSFVETVGRFPQAAHTLLKQVPDAVWMLAAAVLGVAFVLYKVGRPSF